MDVVNFCYYLILKGNPGIPEQRIHLAEEMRVKRGDVCNIDQIAVNLQFLSKHDAWTIRQNAMTFLADRIIRVEFKKGTAALSWLYTKDRRMAVWAALACANNVAQYLNDNRSTQALTYANQWVHNGSGGTEQSLFFEASARKAVLDTVDLGTKQSLLAVSARASALRTVGIINGNEFGQVKKDKNAASYAAENMIYQTGVTNVSGSEKERFNALEKQKELALVSIIADAMLKLPAFV